MTVCLAAICENDRVIGVADRMLTAGDVEFEPPQPKVWKYTDSICVMTAGDTTLQTEILGDVATEVHRRIVAQPAYTWRVRDVADLYRQRYEQIRSRRAESAVLSPLGMDRESFIKNQAGMDRDIAASMAAEMKDYAMPRVEAIFVGVDNDGPLLLDSGAPGVYPHIYVSDGGQISCHDSVGFAAIGIGDWHARSQFMFAKHTRGRPFPETLFLAYSAKKHAAVAPGVGKETDVFSIGPSLGTYFPLGEHIIAEAEAAYKDNRRAINEATNNAERAFRKFVEELVRSRFKSQFGESTDNSAEVDPEKPAEGQQQEPSP